MCSDGLDPGFRQRNQQFDSGCLGPSIASAVVGIEQGQHAAAQHKGEEMNTRFRIHRENAGHRFGEFVHASRRHDGVFRIDGAREGGGIVNTYVHSLEPRASFPFETLDLKPQQTVALVDQQGGAAAIVSGGFDQRGGNSTNRFFGSDAAARRRKHFCGVSAGVVYRRPHNVTAYGA